MIEGLLFWTCCLTVIIGALGAALLRHLLHAGLFLGICLAGVAGLYLFLNAEYLACIQIVVYIGGILVLVLFATLFSGDIAGTHSPTPRWLVAVGGLGALLALAVSGRLAALVLERRGAAANISIGLAPDHVGSGVLGTLLTNAFEIPFILVGVLLTVVLVGAVSIVLHHQKGPMRGTALPRRQP